MSEELRAEINKVLRQGGFVFVQVPEYRDHEWALTEAYETHWVLEPGTHVPLAGVEQGVPHHCFRQEELLQLFSNYEPEEIHMGTDHYKGFCFLAKKGRR